MNEDPITDEEWTLNTPGSVPNPCLEIAMVPNTPIVWSHMTTPEGSKAVSELLSIPNNITAAEIFKELCKQEIKNAGMKAVFQSTNFVTLTGAYTIDQSIYNITKSYED